MKPLAPAGEKIVAIVQSNYIPWKGFFDLVNLTDEFILYDDVQFTKRDWRNRNRIKTAQGTLWLTIPVVTKDKYLQKICETQISDSSWASRHWETIRQSYARAPFFREYAPVFESCYARAEKLTHLSQVNHLFMETICPLLGIRTKLSWSSQYPHTGTKTDALLEVCRAAGARHYLSGPAARAYMQEDLFAQAGIGLHYMNYDGYPEYPQLHGAFEHAVSVLDLLFSAGPGATRLMKTFTPAAESRAA